MDSGGRSSKTAGTMFLPTILTFMTLGLCAFVNAQQCGKPGQRPCSGAECLSGAVFYKPGTARRIQLPLSGNVWAYVGHHSFIRCPHHAADFCTPCGGEAEFCCNKQGTWSCESGMTCQILPNPFDKNSTGAPLGLGRLCLSDFNDPGNVGECWLSLPLQCSLAARMLVLTRVICLQTSHHLRLFHPQERRSRRSC